MKPTEVFPLFGETLQAMGPFFQPYGQAVEATGLAQQEWGVLAVAHDFDPDHSSVAMLQIRNPYTNPDSIAERLESLAAKGQLQAVGNGDYALTAAGRATVKELSDRLDATLRPLSPLPTADLERTAALMRQLIDSIAAAPDPADKRCFSYNRDSDPGPAGAVMLRILQYLADFNAFRDDAHLNAWRRHAVSGPAWEALTFLWRDEAHTAAELAEKLPFRELTAGRYAAALDELSARGWITAAGDQHTVTAAGQQVREEVEVVTDRTYYAAWDTFSEAELDELGGLLGRLRDGLVELHPAPEDETT